MTTIKSLSFACAVLLLCGPTLRAGSSARQTITFPVDAIAVLAVKQGGSGAGGMDLGAG